MSPVSVRGLLAVAEAIGRRSGGPRVVFGSAGLAAALALAAAALPGSEGAARGPLVAAGALAAVALAGGTVAVLAGAAALARSPDLLAVAATPVGAAGLAGGASLGLARIVLAAAAGAGGAGLLALALAGGATTPAERWIAPATSGGGIRSGGLLWAQAGASPVEVRFHDLRGARVPDGPVEVTLRARFAEIRGGAGHGHPGHGAPEVTPAEPVLVEAGPPADLRPVPVEGSLGDGRGVVVSVPRGRLGEEATLVLRLSVGEPGLALGFPEGGVLVRGRPGSLLGAAARGWLALLPPLALVAALALAASARLAPGLAAVASGAAAVALAAAPISREALALLGSAEGAGAAALSASRGVLSLLPSGTGAFDALLAGDDVPWATVIASAGGHLPFVVLACAGAAWLLRGRDW
ncbi:MAG: hypothetical protein L0216_10420 [Planctomycetales bacterium]|nr:hypothetical protein [Planctomycetales bacterium]